MARVILIISFLLLTQPCFADPIYRSVNKQGAPLYTNKEDVSETQKAELPQITKQALSSQQKSAEKDKPLSSCSAHGGVNCQLGSDSDGSVICYDGFRNSLQRFVFSCSRAKLVVIDPSFKSAPNFCSVTIRNESSVPAKNVSVLNREGMKFIGPSEIAGYDSGEYTIQSPVKSVGQINLSCDNC